MKIINKNNLLDFLISLCFFIFLVCFPIDLLSKNVSEQRFDMLLYNKKNKDKIEAYRKEVDFYDKEAKIVFSQD